MVHKSYNKLYINLKFKKNRNCISIMKIMSPIAKGSHFEVLKMVQNQSKKRYIMLAAKRKLSLEYEPRSEEEPGRVICSSLEQTSLG